MGPLKDGKIRVRMWSSRRRLTLLALLFGCHSAEPGPGVCSPGTTQVQGVCRQTCNNDGDCLLSELCGANPSVCIPEPMTDTPKVKRFEVAPTPVSSGEPVTIDYGVVSADHLRLQVEWSDGDVQVLVDSDSELFGTRVVDAVTRNGIVRLVATRGGVDQPHTRAIELDDGTPRIEMFSASPARVSAGATVTLSWSVKNANAPIKIGIEDGQTLAADAPPDGTLEQRVEATTAFVLSSGDLLARAEVQVVAAVDPEIVAFGVKGLDPSPHDYPAAVSWQTRNAVSATLVLDGTDLFTTASPYDVDAASFPLIVPAGQHVVSLVATGAMGQKVMSTEVPVAFSSSQPPEITRFDHPPFIDSNGTGMSIGVSWMIDAPDPFATSAVFNWADRPVGDVAFQGQEVRPQASATLKALLRAESPAGVAEARGSIFATLQEIEPNDDVASAQPLDDSAVGGTVGLLDADVFEVGIAGPGQSVQAALYGKCMAGLALTLIDAGGFSASVQSQANGDCPRLSFHPQTAGPVFARVEWTLGDVTFTIDYRLAAEILDPICGDGEVAEIELCDDGNRANGDGCSGDCVPEDTTFYQIEEAAVGGLDPRPGNAREISLHGYSGGGASPTDEGFGLVELPGGFPYFERTYYAAVVHTNGFVGLLPDVIASRFDAVDPLAPGAPNALIAVAGANLRASAATGGIYTWTDNGDVMIEYDAFVLVGDVTSRLTARLTLEKDGKIRIGYPRLFGLGPGVEFEAGLQDRHGARTTYLPACDPRCGREVIADLEGRSFELVPGGIR